VPELNQLLLPFLTLVTLSELDRNPTVKEEIQSAGLKRINAGMYTYPIHQAADILFCKGNVVPVGKDQLPHLEITRTIARRFNEKFGQGRQVFPEPQPLLSQAPLILGLDGSQKMSKSRNNAIMLSATAEETAALIKKAKTDSERRISYDPVNRPEVSNLILLASLSTGRDPESIAEGIGDGGSGKLKSFVTEALNDYLRPIREKRRELETDLGFVRGVLRKGIEGARAVAIETSGRSEKRDEHEHLAGTIANRVLLSEYPAHRIRTTSFPPSAGSGRPDSSSAPVPHRACRGMNQFFCTETPQKRLQPARPCRTLSHSPPDGTVPAHPHRNHSSHPSACQTEPGRKHV
jgi:tryptophanyl-tRNA synthetase